MAYNRQARQARQHHADLPALARAPKLNPVDNLWPSLRQNWLSNTAIMDAA
jgi:hypothetical protein